MDSNFMVRITLILFVCDFVISGKQLRDLVWSGGPLSFKCEKTKALFTLTGQHVKENVIAIKALPVGEEIYVAAPRFKRSVLATVWQIVQGEESGVELLPFPEREAHSVSNCHSIQNTVDFFSDYLGNLWILDTGIIDNIERPICTCPPKVVAVSTLLKTLTKTIDLTNIAAPESVLQNIVVEYRIGGIPFIYISDASRGMLIIHDVTTGSQWTVNVCPPSIGLQLVLMKTAPMQQSLMMVRLNYPGIMEIDTASLRKRSGVSAVKLINEHLKPIVLVGSDFNYIYFRYTETNDIFAWDVQLPYNITGISRVHLPDPNLTTTSVALDTLRHVLVILDSNYGHSVTENQPTFHKISFVMQKV